MITRENLVDELREQLLVADNSTLYPEERLISLIKNAYLWATQLVIWHDLVKAVYTNSFANFEYYDYPQEFRSESIQRLEVNGLKYSRRNFQDYLDFRKNNPNSQKRIFASFGRQYFISPTIPTAGLEITLWGAVQAPGLDNDGSIPIFSYNKQEGNEAVVRKAFSVGIKRIDPSLSKSEEQEATVTLLRLSKMEQDNTQSNKRLDHPMLDVPDYLGGSSGNPIGGFSYLPEDTEDY